MSEITLETVHSLLEKLADYVMTEIPAIKRDVAMLKQDVAMLKQDVAMLKQDVAMLKQDVARLEKNDLSFQEKFDLILDGMDAQSRELADIRLELKSISRTLDIFNDRIGKLEEKNFGYRVREEE